MSSRRYHGRREVDVDRDAGDDPGVDQGGCFRHETSTQERESLTEIQKASPAMTQSSRITSERSLFFAPFASN